MKKILNFQIFRPSSFFSYVLQAFFTTTGRRDGLRKGAAVGSDKLGQQVGKRKDYDGFFGGLLISM